MLLIGLKTPTQNGRSALEQRGAGTSEGSGIVREEVLDTVEEGSSAAGR